MLPMATLAVRSPLGPGELPPLRVPGEVASDLGPGCAREWLETNGLGSFAMGTVAGPGTRRYHALLCAATRPPLGRMVLVNRCEEELRFEGVGHMLGANFYPGGVVHPEGHLAIVEFRLDPWPTWVYQLGSARLERAVFMPQGQHTTVVSWRLLEGERARLFVRPLLSGRDYHALHHENQTLKPDADVSEGLVVWRPYDGVPAVYLHHNGVYAHRPDWYRAFQYPAERERGLDFTEDLWSPGELAFDLTPQATALAVFTTEGRAVPDVAELRGRERARRRELVSGIADDLQARLALAADRFVVARGGPRTVLAGYPWFTDWGRDTFIALPGLALQTGRYDLARELLLGFATWVKDGLIPNCFPDEGGRPEYNTVDAPLWYVLAACRFARAAQDDSALVRERILPAARQIIEGYLAGTLHGIGLDDDGLIHAAAPGLQLTWMDAKVEDWVVTPRMGKPVEVQALWVAALEAFARLHREDDPPLARELEERAAWARSSFAAAFWDDGLGYLYDCIDGTRKDATLRPNQLYALGLCSPLIEPAKARRVLDVVERELLTRVGLRSRGRDDQYRGRALGSPRERDGAYHQGTVWPYLLGIYADACVRVRGHVHPGLLDGLRNHLQNEGLGTVYEIFDGDPPHHPRGCPAQAWSVAEMLRIAAGRLGEDA
jgi:predicted glycogen debranching enzyme